MSIEGTMELSYRDLLLKTAERVEEPGMWLQREAYQDTKDWLESPACALGHLRAVGHQLGLSDIVIREAHMELTRFVYMPFSYWNDQEGRTAAEVASVMREVASLCT